MARARRAQDRRAKSLLVNAILAVLFIIKPSLLTNKFNGKGQKGRGLQGQKPLGQCYLGSGVHYWAILAVTPTGILSVVALLTSTYDGKGQKGTSSQGQKPLGQC